MLVSCVLGNVATMRVKPSHYLTWRVSGCVLVWNLEHLWEYITEIAEQRTKLSFDDLELAGAMTVGE